MISIASYAAAAAFIRDARMGEFSAPIAPVSFVGSQPLTALLLAAEKKSAIPLTAKSLNTQVVPPPDDVTYPLG